MDQRKPAKKPKRNLKNVRFEQMCAIPINEEDLLTDPVFMDMKQKIHVDDDLTSDDIKTKFLQEIWEGDEEIAILSMEKLQRTQKWDKNF